MKGTYNNYNSILFFKNIKWYLKVYNFKIRKALNFTVLFIRY